MTKWQPQIEDEPGPRYLALAEAIARAIADGDLAAGQRLPTHRDLARRLQLSVHTVSEAYGEAARRGLVSGEVGRGTFVRQAADDGERHFIMDRRLENLIDLSINRPAQAAIHAERVRTALAQLEPDPSALVCRPIAGLDHHRAAGARWLTRRGLDVDPERVVVCNGAAHGLLVALSTLTRPGDLVVCEALVDHGVIALAELLNLRLQPLPVDDEGIVPDDLDAACSTHEVKALCTTPCLNNPTASLMSEERRREIAAIALRHGIAVVEDDVYGPLVEDGPPALSGFCPQLAYHVSSFTKFLISGLRTGYVVGPDGRIPALVRRVRATSWMGTPLIAELATRWVLDGTAEELLRWQRAELRERNALADAILRGFRVSRHETSLHRWLELPDDWRAANFVAEARLRDVAVTPAEPFAVGDAPAHHGVRISLGATRTRAQLRAGLEVLAALLHHAPEPYYMPM